MSQTENVKPVPTDVLLRQLQERFRHPMPRIEDSNTNLSTWPRALDLLEHTLNLAAFVRGDGERDGFGARTIGRDYTICGGFERGGIARYKGDAVVVLREEVSVGGDGVIVSGIGE